VTAARLADALPSWLGAYVAHAPRAAAVVAGPDGAVLAANPAFVAWHGPAGGPVDGPPAVAALLALAAHTGAPAHGVLPGRDPAQHDAWDCVAWPATDRCAGGGPAPVVLELTPAGPVARVDAQHRDVAERLLLAALREHRLAADAEAARQTAERDMLARSAELARSNAALAQEMTERAELERARNALRRELAGAEEGERRRLARELHDQFGQHLTGLTLGLAEVRRLLPPDAPAHARLTALQTLAADLTRDARTLALELRPPELDDVGLEEALESYVAGWAARYGVAADVAGHRARHPGAR
jgi:hypothetical protein